MSASGSRENVLASVVFQPVLEGPVTRFYARNCAGAPGAAVPPLFLADAPLHMPGAGHYRTFCPDDLTDKQVSITKRSTSANKTGFNRFVTVVLTPPALSAVPGFTQVDIFIKRADALNPDGVLTDVDDLTEVTFARLPL